MKSYSHKKRSVKSRHILTGPLQPALFALAAWVFLPPVANVASTLPAADSLPAKPTEAIAWSQLGAKAGADYHGDGLAVIPTTVGARLRCVFQRLEGEVTREGLWLTSSVAEGVSDRFRVTAVAVGRADDLGVRRQSAVATPLCGAKPIKVATAASESGAALCFPPQSKALPRTGAVEVADKLVRFLRSGVVEEYSVSVDGVQQDFLVLEKPPLTVTPNVAASRPSAALSRHAMFATLSRDAATVQRLADRPDEGMLRVELDVTGASVEAAADGAQLVLPQSGRKIAYSRLRVTDATGRELPARMEVVVAASRESAADMAGEDGGALPSRRYASLAVVVNDADAIYPVRIDPTFSDANWVSMGGLSGAGFPVYATVVDGAGNLYIGGAFTTVGEISANYVATWNGSGWSPLGTGMNSNVFALAVSGNELYAGGQFTTADGSAANYIAKWDGSRWNALGAGMNQYVLALAISGSNLFVGGLFTTADGSTANRIAKWDGITWSTLGSGMNNGVYALAASGSELYAGGQFTTADGNAANCIAKWDGIGWSALGAGMNTNVYALAISGSTCMQVVISQRRAGMLRITSRVGMGAIGAHWAWE